MSVLMFLALVRTQVQSAACETLLRAGSASFHAVSECTALTNCFYMSVTSFKAAVAEVKKHAYGEDQLTVHYLDVRRFVEEMEAAGKAVEGIISSCASGVVSGECEEYCAVECVQNAFSYSGWYNVTRVELGGTQQSQKSQKLAGRYQGVVCPKGEYYDDAAEKRGLYNGWILLGTLLGLVVAAVCLVLCFFKGNCGGFDGVVKDDFSRTDAKMKGASRAPAVI